MKEWLLRTFNSTKSVIIKTDASDYIIAKVLSQKEGSVEFISYKTNNMKQNYTIAEKKMLVII